MRTLQEVQTSFDWMGFNPKLKPFNHKIRAILAITIPAVISQWKFLVHDANNAREYMESIYIVSVCSGVFLCFASTIFITKKLFAFINSVDELMNESKYQISIIQILHRFSSELIKLGSKNSTLNEFLEKTNELVENWTKIGVFCMEYGLCPCLVIPKAIVSYFIFFTTDADRDAFYLPFPMW